MSANGDKWTDLRNEGKGVLPRETMLSIPIALDGDYLTFI